MAKLLPICVFVFMFIMFMPTTWAVDYKVVILNVDEEFHGQRANDVSGDHQLGYAYDFQGNPHPLLWSGTSQNVIDLLPSSYQGAQAWGVSNGKQVGLGYFTYPGPVHALLWSGTPESVVDLHPSGFVDSGALGISGWQQVGYADNHAVLWSGTPESIVDLHPSGFSMSQANDIDNGQIVGYADNHAVLWSVPNNIFVDLHPSGFGQSRAIRISGNQQVGYGDNHALLWYGTAESVVDLNPNGCDSSVAAGVSSGQQVGYGDGMLTGYDIHALLWYGTADSVVDLHNFLSTDYGLSRAYSIDTKGIIVGYAMSNEGHHAVMWIPCIFVEIDIKPGSYPNSINLGNEGVIPVAILSSWEFDSTTVDPATVELAGAGVELRGKSDKAMAHKEDVDNDGLIDLVVQIATQNLDPGAFQDGYATLTGITYDGTAFEGSDEINIVPK